MDLSHLTDLKSIYERIFPEEDSLRPKMITNPDGSNEI